MTDWSKAIKTASVDVGRARDRALPEAVRAVRELEAELVAALDGEPLRGLRNLAGSASFYGARVRAKPDKKLPTPGDQKGERDFLCIDARGKLVVLWWADAEDEPDTVELRDRPAQDGDLRIDDVQGMLTALEWILPRHLEASEKTARRYEAVAELSDRVAEVFGGDAHDEEQ